MIEISFHDVEKVLLTEPHKLSRSTTRTLRIISGTGEIDIVLFSGDAETLEIETISDEDL